MLTGDAGRPMPGVAPSAATDAATNPKGEIMQAKDMQLYRTYAADGGTTKVRPTDVCLDEDGDLMVSGQWWHLNELAWTQGTGAFEPNEEVIEVQA